MNSHIAVKTEQGHFKLDLQGNENVSFIYLISDIKDVSKKRTSYSKTININGTKNNNNVLNHIFEITSDSTFNANKAVSCQFVSDGQPIITGKLKLTKVNYFADNNTVDYDVVIYSGNYDLASLLGDKKLNELDLSGWNHTLTSDNVVNSWTSNSTPYVYPIVDYDSYFTLPSINMANTQDDFIETTKLNPWLKVKPLFYKIFQEAGLSIESNFLNDDLFSSLITNTTTRLRYTAEELKSQRFRAEQVSGVIDIQNPLISFTPTLSAVTVSDDYTVGFDHGNVYNTTTGEIQFPFNNFSTSFELGLKWKDNGFSTASIDFVLRIYLYKNGVAIWDNGQYLLCNGNNLLNGVWLFNTPSFTSQPSDIYKFVIQVETQNPFVGALQLEAGTYIQNNPSFLDDWLTIGDTVNVANFINPNTKQIEFVSAIFKTFNLFIEQSNFDSSTYVIEPRNEFYSGGRVVDWTSKLDISQPIKQQLLSELQSKNFVFSWSKDDDYYNKTYSDKYDGDVYGQHDFEVDNDFLDVNSVMNVQPLFTPLIERTIVGSTNISTPLLFDWDNAQIRLRDNVPFKLACFKYIPLCDEYILGSARGQFQTFFQRTDYGYAGSLYPSFANPEFSLNFGTPEETKYLGSAFTQIGMFYPTKNIYTEFYSDYIDEITNKNNKLITAKFYLNNSDIANLSFRNAIKLRINGNVSYFKLNAINNYSPNSNSTCEVELIKSDNTVPAPRIYRKIVVRSDNGNGSTQVGRISLGKNNQVLNPFSAAIGNSNVIEDSYSIIFGSNNTAKGSNTVITGRYNTGSSSSIIIGGSGNTVEGINSAVIAGRNNIIDSKKTSIDGNIIIGGENNRIRFGNSNNLIIASTGSTILTTGITNSVIIGSTNSQIQGADNRNTVILGGQNIAATSANTTYIQRGVVTEFYRGELPSDSARMVVTDKFGYLQPITLSGANGIAVTNSGGSITWSFTGVTSSGDAYWTGGTLVGDLLRTESNHSVNAGYTIVLNGSYNSGYTPNSVVSGAKNIAHGSYFVPYSLFTGIYGLNQIAGGLNTIYGSLNNIHNGFYNTISNTSYSTILNGSNNKVVSSPLSIASGSNNKAYSTQHAIVTGNNNIITTANTTYSSFSSILNSSTSRIEDSSFSNILGGKFSSITGGSVYNIHNVILNSDQGKIHGKRNSIINGFNNFIIANSEDCTSVSGQDNQIMGGKSSIIFNGRQNTINGSTGVTLINVSYITTTTADTNTLITNKIRAISLTGGTTQMVVADLNGNLSVQAIPTSGSSVSNSIVNGINTFTGGSSSVQSVNVTGLSITNLTVSAATSLNTLSATTLQVRNLSGATTRMVIANNSGVISTQSIPPTYNQYWTVGSVASAMIQNNGYTNANSDYSIVAGKINTIGGNSNYSTILGGNGNVIAENTQHSSIVNGMENYVKHYSLYSFIGNGRGGYIDKSNKSTIINGYLNKIYNTGDVTDSKYNSILGGYQNKILRGLHSSILGGNNNVLGIADFITKYSTIVGGKNYTLTEDYTCLVPKLKIANLPSTIGTYMLVTNSYGNVFKNALPNLAHSIINGLNTFTAGTSSIQTVNISALTISNLTVSAGTSLNTLSATTIYSGSTNLSNLFLNSNSLVKGTNIRLSGSPNNIIINSSHAHTGFLTNNNLNVGALPSQYKRYYHNTINFVSTMGAAAPGANTLRLYPWINNRTIQLNEVGVNCTTSGASGVMAIAIYDSLPNSELRPNRLLQVFGSASTTTTGVKLVTGNTITIEAGIYWFAINNNSAAQFSSPASGCISLGSNSSINTQVASMSSAATFSMNFPASMSGASTYAQATLLFSYYPLAILD